jgi:hypothetical protein
MSGAPPEDGDAEGRAPKRGRLNIFGELGKLYDAELQAQKETHEQEMQALREAHKQEVQKLNAEIHRGGPASVSNGSAVPQASSEVRKRVWMIKYDAAHVMTMDRFEVPGYVGFLERIENIHMSFLHPNGRESYVSLLYFKDPHCFDYVDLFCAALIRSKIFPLVSLSLELTCAYASRLNFLSVEEVEKWGVGPNKEKILLRLLAWGKRGPCMWKKGEQPLFPFKQVHA